MEQQFPIILKVHLHDGMFILVQQRRHYVISFVFFVTTWSCNSWTLDQSTPLLSADYFISSAHLLTPSHTLLMAVKLIVLDIDGLVFLGFFFK